MYLVCCKCHSTVFSGEFRKKGGGKGGGPRGAAGEGTRERGGGRREVAKGWAGVEKAYDCSELVPQVNDGQFRWGGLHSQRDA